MSTEQILSSDGIPLEVSLKKAERKNKIKALLLVAPLFLFLIITYVFPIGDMLFRSVDDRMITKCFQIPLQRLRNGMVKNSTRESICKHFIMIYIFSKS